jgi:hypothetical protein
MWKQWKGVSFEAVQGPYEHSIELQRTKMRQLRNGDKNLFGPKTVLSKEQIEKRMKATKEARRTRQILKWMRLIQDMLTWRTAESISKEVETEMNGGKPLQIKSHKEESELNELHVCARILDCTI